MKMRLLAGIAAVATLSPGLAHAADLGYPPLYKPAPIPFNWSGCFVGGHAASASGHTTWQDAVLNQNGSIDANNGGNTAHTDMSGALYGGQLGCDWQPTAGNFVLGLQGTLSASTLTGTNMDQFNNTWSLRAQSSWMADVTGRLGWSADHTLIYGRGGVAWARNKFEIENAGFLDGTPQATRTGYIVGAGVEWAFAPNWSMFGEADYYNFGTSTVSFPGDVFNPTLPFGVKTSQTIEALQLGVNYRFVSGQGFLTAH